MQLKIPNFQGVTAAMLRQPAGKVGDRVNKFVSDVEQKLHGMVSSNWVSTLLNIHLQLPVQF